MGNHIFNMMNRQASPMNGNNMLSLMQRFNQFKSMFQGDPKQQVQDLIASGQMSKEQFEQLSSMAKQFQMIGSQRG